MAKADLKVRKLTDEHVLTIKVNVTREFRARLFIAATLLKLAAVVLGCGIEIISSTDDNEQEHF